MEFPTAAEIEAGLAAYNRFIAGVWTSKQSELEARAAAAARELVEREVLIREVESLELHLEGPPALNFEGAVDGPGPLTATLSAPGEGHWRVLLVLKVLVPFRRRPRRAEIKIRNLRIDVEIELDRESPTEISFVDSDVSVDLDVDVRGLGRVVSKLIDVFDDVAEILVRRSLGESFPDRDALEVLGELGLAASPIDLPDEAPLPLEELEARAVRVSERIAGPERHLKFGTVLNTLVDRDGIDAVDDLGGPARGFRQFEDSAIWTGHFIAGEVYRYQVTRDPAALENIRRGLDGLDHLIHLTGDPGLLSRVSVPLEETEIVAALDNERIDAGHRDRLFVSVDGRFRSIGHITRDQYAGAFLGTGLAALRVDDEAVSAQARRIALEMLEYLVPRRFCPTEAEADPATGIQHTSVTYLLNPTQVMAILRLARSLDPERFTEAYEDFFPAWSVLWFFQWLRTLDPHDSYFKFNLEHALGLVMLTIEGDGDDEAAARRELEQLSLSFRAMRGPIRFHANAWFNLVELETLGGRPELLARPRQEIEHETRHLVAQTFEREPLILTVDLAGEFPDDVVDYRGTTRSDLAGEPEKISRRVIDVVKRPGADFLWQRSPFNLRVVWKGLPVNPAMRSPNIDVTLPYWMARRLGL